MTNSKQQTAVDIIYQGMSDKIVMQDVNKALICIHISHDDFIKLHKQAKETEKERMIQFACDVFDKNYKTDASFKDTAKHLYQQTYGDNK